MKEGKYFMQLKTSTSNNNIAKKKKILLLIARTQFQHVFIISYIKKLK